MVYPDVSTLWNKVQISVIKKRHTNMVDELHGNSKKKKSNTNQKLLLVKIKNIKYLL